ncbi:MAG: hypothetical protein QM754_04025 [Tepidisphaeraceae bacterium]
MRPETFDIGDHVVIEGHWEFPDGTTGVIAEPDPFMVSLVAGDERWMGHRRTVRGREGPIVFYYVVFDRPTDDGSGDGPYRGGEIDASSLRRAVA